MERRSKNKYSEGWENGKTIPGKNGPKSHIEEGGFR
jgi:hypothetical protein